MRNLDAAVQKNGGCDHTVVFCDHKTDALRFGAARMPVGRIYPPTNALVLEWQAVFVAKRADNQAHEVN